MNKILRSVLIILLTIPFFAGRSVFPAKAQEKNNTFAIVTYAGDNIQERSTRVFIRSVRELGGVYKNSTIYVVLADTENFPCRSLQGNNVVLLPLDMNPDFKSYPLAVKAFVAAQVEKIVPPEVTTLAWFDPATLVLGSLEELDLKGQFRAAVRPVSLVNTIGISPGAEPDEYWAPIYTAFGLNHRDLPSYKTVVDEQPIQPYLNCEIFSVDPRLGIFSDWAAALTKFLQDEAYQENVCTTFLRKLFLHQAVLSGAITAKAGPGEIKSLSLKTGYPFGQHARLADTKKTQSLNDLSAVIFDYAWETDPGWMDRIPVKEPLRDRLIDYAIDYMKLTKNLFRMEGSCNSYLITTDEGSVLIDPAGAATSPQYFQKILDEHPLKAVLLTHAHRDHWDQMEVWRTDPAVPIIAQREFVKYNEYWKRLAPFFARRGAIWGRRPLPSSTEVESFDPVVPTITFTDETTYELGGFHFHMTHTPGETPDHTTIWIPELKAVFVGDNYFAYFINNATLRGTLTRPVLGYIHALDLALSYKPDFFLPGHDAPVVSKNIIQGTVSNLRGAIRYIHDETIKGINEGKDVHILMKDIKVPDRFRIQPFFGKVEWTVRGIYHENIGWFDENPASMYAEPPESVYADVIRLAGGPDKALTIAREYLEKGDFVKTLHLTDMILRADPGHRATYAARLEALKGLKSLTRNYIELIWLDYGIRLCEEHIKTDDPSLINRRQAHIF